MSDELERLQIRLKKLQAREEALIAKAKEKDRKARTRRLIQTGAIFEKYFGEQSPDDAEQMFIYFLKKED